MGTEISVPSKVEGVSKSQATKALQEKLIYLNQMKAQEIADYLRSYGVVGNFNNIMDCPISVWLRLEIPWIEIAIVGTTQSSIYPVGGVTEGPGTSTAVSMTEFDNVLEFIANFDDKKYPELIDT